jgi:acetylornithine/succinyldiaminopimelate/putrescine aminotransferase
MLSERVNDLRRGAGLMTEMELSNDPVAVLEKAQVDIETARRILQGLYEQLVMTNESAEEIARNELCRALVERLQIAEREAVELAELVVLARK